MNSQTPTPDDGQPTEPLPPRDPDQPTEPLLPPPAASQDTPPAAGPDAGPYAGPSAGPYSSAKAPGQSGDFFTWVRSHGIQRGRDRWIGGVSSGIAHRMGIDPLIVRGIFIVLTLFAGIGVLLYGLAWAFLPEPDGRIHVQEAGAGRWSSGMTGALITTVVGLTGLGGGFWGWSRNGFGGFLWTVFWVGGAIYFIYYLTQRNKARNGAPMTAAPQPAGANSGYPAAPTAPYASPFAATDSASTRTSSTSGATGSAPYLPVPPSSVNPPYGGGSYGGGGSDGGAYGGYQPPQGPARAPKVRPSGPGAPAVAITAGTALLVGGGLKALHAGNVINLGDAANAIVWASGAAILGLGILVAGLRGRTSGILGFFAVVALVIGGIFNVVGNGDRVRFTQVDWAPTSQQQAADGFSVTGGRGTVDLTQLGAQAPLDSEVVVPLDITASNVTVILPSNIPVDVRADMTLGNLNEGTNHRGGITSQETSYNTDKPGGHLIIRIDGTLSNVTIQEGN
ncbi:PspC domain-containing protein [Pseudarthrobacter cellobiosi]|uniref:PspC domain-containing protein n=1 Tax=Pseudarthrobacter cellobiosi TaxID=2953654 RepID=UPI00208DE3C3|nr:PspC domain-containing protein [Pseudarthrobacter sp. HLT1-5]MCO4256832.1 PspC domain-containing protein [Pseudarthrobacter sp. HLT1-5]